jgi:hypothetical protein
VALIIPLWTNFAMMKKFIFIVYTYQVWGNLLQYMQWNKYRKWLLFFSSCVWILLYFINVRIYKK